MGNVQATVKVLRKVLDELEKEEKIEAVEEVKQYSSLSEMSSEEEEENTIPPNSVEKKLSLKTCKDCKVDLTTDKFHTDNTRKDNLKARCKLCIKKRVLKRKSVKQETN